MKQQPKGVTVPVPGTTRTVACRTAPGLFSADRLDDGTRLLLEHLPPGMPARVLDLGCGWGAISVAVAAAFPAAHVTAVDRDLLAVEVTASNAAALGLTGIVAQGGIGTSGLTTTYDWALCNVPARIGAAAIGAMLGGCAQLVGPAGSVRAVVIRDLTAPTLATLAAHGLPAEIVARSATHAIVALAGSGSEGPRDRDVYDRDEVVIAGRPLSRPFDLGEEPAHLSEGLPLLLDFLPRRADGVRAAVLRGGYGAVALELAARGAKVTAVDRDLLAAAFTGKNATRHGLTVAIATTAHLPNLVADGMDLVVLEPSEPMGDLAAGAELAAARSRLAPGGRLVCLARTRFAEALRARAPDLRVLASRSGYRLLEARPPTRN